MRVVVVVQARVGSSRLPGKALRTMAGEPMVRHVLRRALALGADAVWLATSVNERDGALLREAAECGVPAFAGNESDVLARVAQAAVAARADVIVRVTGDCPAWAPDIGRRVLDAHLARCDPWAFTSNDTTVSGWADGLDTEVFGRGLLMEANRRAQRRTDIEHVTPWMRRHGAVQVVGSSEDWRAVKLSVDTAEDFARVGAVLGVLDGGGYGWPATRSALLRSGYGCLEVTT
jgi:spore coat polysaccharide biosynthesis protein SpsF (cytidylyltransferase family)